MEATNYKTVSFDAFAHMWSKDFLVIAVSWEWRLQTQSHIINKVNWCYSQHNFSAFCHATILEVCARDIDISFEVL